MPAPAYLEPYVRACEQFPGRFGSLLWASRKTQAARFNALARHMEVSGRSLLDAGCGHADFLDFLLVRRTIPGYYIGLEAIETTALVAHDKRRLNSKIIRGDFVLDPSLLDQKSEVVLFCGSLNTLSKDEFYDTLTQAWQFTGRQLGFNFLSSDRLARGNNLNWRPKFEVMLFAQSLGGKIAVEDAYIDGDCTVVIDKR